MSLDPRSGIENEEKSSEMSDPDHTPIEKSSFLLSQPLILAGRDSSELL